MNPRVHPGDGGRRKVLTSPPEGRPDVLVERPETETFANEITLQLLSRPYILAPGSDGTVGAPDTDDDYGSTEHVRALVEQAQDGDTEAFGDLYRMYHASIYRLARFYLPGDAAEDVVGETFMRAWGALPRYRRTGAPFASWLYGIARHVVFDMLRVRKRTHVTADVPDQPHEPYRHSDNCLEIADALADLPDEQRRVIEMKFLMGFTNPEVAEILGKSIGAVNAQQWRALANLRARLERT